jgi:hypothetical protein
VTVVAFDPLGYERSWWHGGQPQLKLTNVISLFIDGVVAGNVTGYLTTPPR